MTKTESPRDKKQRSFWQRQFDVCPTVGQIAFDVMFGLLIPGLCFLIDPGIFHGNFSPTFLGAPLSHHSLFVYALSGIVGLALATWLIFGTNLRSFAGLVAGVLLAGAACALLIGIILLPLTLLGLIFMVGVLGFTPILAGFVYLRNGLRSLHEPTIQMERAWLSASLLLGMTLSLTGPIIVDWKVNQVLLRSVQGIIRNDPASDTAVNRVKYLSWAVDLDPIVLAYERETDSPRKERLAAIYREITGTRVESRLAILRD